jgi:tetratricopeptide (TPR) repeat protein
MRSSALLLICCLAAIGGEERSEKIGRLLESGQIYYLKADYPAARQAYEDAWQLAQETLPADPLRYTLVKRLAAVNAAAGQYAEAETYMQQALTWRENQFGSTEAQAIEDLLEVANLCRRMKDLERALVVLDRVQSLHMQTSGRESLPVADDMSRRAAVMAELKRPETAVVVLEMALALRQKLSGADSQTLLADLDRLGELNIALRRYDKAEDTYRHALVIRERLYGREHADLIATLDGLAYACYGQKKYDDAEPTYQRLLGVWTASAGKEHPMIATVLDKLAGVYADQKKWDQANAAVEQANAVRARFLAVGFAQSGGLRLMAGDMEGAKTYYRKALALMDPPNPLFDELREQVEKDLKAMEPPPKPAAPKPGARKPAPRKK